MEPQQTFSTPTTPNTPQTPPTFQTQTQPTQPVPTPPIEPPLYTPPVSSAPSYFPPTSPVIYEKRSRGWKKIILILIILILFVGIPVYAYFFVLAPDWAIPFALSRIDNTQKPHVSLNVSLSEGVPIFGKTDLQVQTDMDRSNEESVNLQTSFNLSSGSSDIAGEVKLIDDVIYGRVIKVPDLYLRYVNSDSVSSINVWYSLKLDTLKTLAENSAYTKSYDLRGRHASLESSYNKLHNAEVISNVEFKGIDNKNGQYLRKYVTTINKEKLVDYIIEELKKDSKVPIDKEMEVSTRAILNSSIKDISFSPISITTSLFSGTIEGISFDITYKIPDYTSPYTKEIVPGKTMKAGLDLGYKINPNSFVISKPEGAIALDGLILKSLDTARERGRSASIKSNLSQFRAEAEIYYDNHSRSYLGVCKDSKSVEIFNSIKNVGVNVTCRDSSQLYIASSPIIDSSATAPTYYCVDSSGYGMTLPKVPATGYSCR